MKGGLSLGAIRQLCRLGRADASCCPNDDFGLFRMQYAISGIATSLAELHLSQSSRRSKRVARLSRWMSERKIERAAFIVTPLPGYLLV